MKKIFLFIATIFAFQNCIATIDIFENELILEIIKTEQHKQSFETARFNTSMILSASFAVLLMLSIIDKNNKHINPITDCIAKINIASASSFSMYSWYLSAQIDAKKELLEKIEQYKRTHAETDLKSFYTYLENQKHKQTEIEKASDENN